MNSAKIVIDVGFGDGGKGLIVDNLCEQENSRELNERSLVVRFSGGQQCGHTVITPDGLKHIFSSFGSGSLLGSPTFFTEDTTLYLPALINEFTVLSSKLRCPDLYVHPLAMLTTPYDVAYNRAKEEFVVKHGSCGLGVGATMKRCTETPYKTFVIDLRYPDLLMTKLNSVKYYYKSLIGDNLKLLSAFEDHALQLLPKFFEAVYHFSSDYFIITDKPPRTNRTIIFEGSQGVMLDMDHGVFPNVTYANTTSKNAFKYVRKWNLTPEIFYVARCYTTRHGEGWMPNDGDIELINNEEEINVHNRWQGGFRLGEFSYEMINQGIAFDKCYHDGWTFPCRKNFVLTCVDQRPDFAFDPYKIAGIDAFWTNDSPRRGSLKPLEIRRRN